MECFFESSSDSFFDPDFDFESGLEFEELLAFTLSSQLSSHSSFDLDLEEPDRDEKLDFDSSLQYCTCELFPFEPPHDVGDPVVAPAMATSSHDDERDRQRRTHEPGPHQASAAGSGRTPAAPRTLHRQQLDPIELYRAWLRPFAPQPIGNLLQVRGQSVFWEMSHRTPLYERATRFLIEHDWRMRPGLVHQ